MTDTFWGTSSCQFFRIQVKSKAAGLLLMTLKFRIILYRHNEITLQIHTLCEFVFWKECCISKKNNKQVQIKTFPTYFEKQVWDGDRRVVVAVPAEATRWAPRRQILWFTSPSNNRLIYPLQRLADKILLASWYIGHLRIPRPGFLRTWTRALPSVRMYLLVPYNRSVSYILHIFRLSILLRERWVCHE